MNRQTPAPNSACLNRQAFVLLVLCLCLGLAALADEPVLKWAYQAQSNLYAPPLAADMHPNPGKETVISDSEARRMRCIDATGQLLWEYNGDWHKRLISAAARSDTNLLLIANGDGRLCCVDAASGTERWQKEIGSVEWGGALWADLDGDGTQEGIVGTERRGVIALDQQGETLWHYRPDKEKAPLEIGCPLAAADIDGDHKAEIFGVGHWGPFCLNSHGTLRWEQKTWDNCPGSPVIADLDGTGPVLLITSSDDDALACFGATTGETRWRLPLLGGVESYSGSAIAVGDLDGPVCGASLDGEAAAPRKEIVAADRAGHVYAVNASGQLRWVFQTAKPVHAAPTLGDVNGDGAIEVLVASGDHHLYCLDRYGILQWKYTTGLRLIHPATITDIDHDGRSDILVCGSDRTLRCLTLDGAYDKNLLPWPSRRYDAAQAGAVFPATRTASAPIRVTRPLLPNGGFEQGKVAAGLDAPPKDSEVYRVRQRLPRGWNAEGVPKQGLDAWALDTDTAYQGEHALKVSKAVRISSDAIPLSVGLGGVRAEVYAKGPGAKAAYLRWTGQQGALLEEPLEQRGSDNGWSHFAADLPFGREDIRKIHARAQWLHLVLESAEGGAWWDAAAVDGVFFDFQTLEVLVNQVGYDTAAPKAFVVQGKHPGTQATFELLRGDEAVYTGTLESRGRITGHFGNDWGYQYWRGDFSTFEEPGTYRLRARIEDAEALSYAFRIGEDALWAQTSRPAYRFFYYQRCGTEIPGFHGACHLDDAVSPDGKTQYELWGGWHDAGDYNTYHNAPYVHGLARAYAIQKAAFDRQDQDGNGHSDFLDEILWGGDHARRMMAPDGSAFGAISSGYGFWGPPERETDNLPGTGDERRIQGQAMGADPSHHHAATARIALYAEDPKPWIEAAERALRWALENKRRGLAQCSTALDLYRATGNDEYAALAHELFPPISASAEVADLVRRFDDVFHEDHTEGLRVTLTAAAEGMLDHAQNPFGVYTHGPKEKPNFFGTPKDQGGWHVGTSSFLLEAANLVALAHQYEPDPRFLAFVYDQFNWTLGVNPFNISLMEGCGSAFLPTYHHRYTFSGVARGAVPGAVANGVTWRGVADDRPYVDLSGVDIPAYEPNEPWLPHNTAYLNALANLQRAKPAH